MGAYTNLLQAEAESNEFEEPGNQVWRAPAWLLKNEPLNYEDALKEAQKEAEADIELLCNPAFIACIQSDRCSMRDKTRPEIRGRFSEAQLRPAMDSFLIHMLQFSLEKSSRMSTSITEMWW